MTKDEIIAALEQLDPSEREEVAFKALDLAGIGLFVGVSLDDVREGIEDTDLEGATDEQILSAIAQASERDWSNETGAAKEIVEECLGNILDGVEA